MLSKKQRQVADAFFHSSLSDQQIINQHNISSDELDDWLENEEFQYELDRLCRKNTLIAKCILSRYAPIAAMQLANLLDAEKEETAGRMALALIDRAITNLKEQTLINQEVDNPFENIAPSVARQLLNDLIEDDNS